MTFALGIVYMLVVCAVIVGMALLYLKGRRTKYNNIYLVCQGAVVLWCSSQIFILLAATYRQMLISYFIGNLGICFVGSLWLLFARLYGKKNVSFLGYGIVLGISLFHFLGILTNSWHHMYYSVFTVEQVVHGPFFYTNVIYTYICVILGAATLITVKNKRQMLLIGASVLLPTIMNLCYLAGWVKTEFDITPLGFAISSILVLVATIRYQFLNINMAAFDNALEDIDDGIVIYQAKGKLVYHNDASTGFLGNVPKDLKDWDKHWDKCQNQRENPDYIQLQRYEQREDKKQETIIFLIKDVTNYYEMIKQERELAVSKEELALSKERNRIAQQVHDTTGHTLTMIQSLTRLAALASEKKQEDKVQEYLREAKELSSSGIKELRESINQLRAESTYELVTQGIMQLANQVHEIKVEVTIQGEDSNRYSHLSKVFYDTFREAITNCLKYACASKLDVILKFQAEYVEMMIADDGKGCESVVDSNGMRGIKERISKAGGSIRIITAPEEGFLIRVKVPVNKEN